VHRNYRRKQGRHNPKKSRGGKWRPYSLSEYRREYWQWARSRERTLMGHGHYEGLPDKHRRSILWDWW
jgi:hypothetical protein